MQFQPEDWRSIPSLPEYEASSYGRVRRRQYVAAMPRGGERRYGGKAWPGSWDGKRFVFVFRGKTYRVAPLICEAFHGPKPAPALVCKHGDENSRNNWPDNLSWGTQKENLNAPGFLENCRARSRDGHSLTMNTARWSA